MRAESLNALLVSSDDQFCAYVNDCLRWAGAERIGRVRTGSAAQSVLSRRRFAYSVVVVQIVEDEAFDVRFIESMLKGTDIALRFIPVVAVAVVRTKSFYRELSGLGFSSLVLSPVRRALLRTVFLKLFQKLQSEFRNPDEGMLAKALVAGDLDYVEERCARALQHHPDEPLYTALLGETAARRKNWIDALKYAELALTRHPERGVPEAIRLKAKALYYTGKKKEAFALVPQVLKQAKGSGQDGAFLVQGLVPLLNQHARHLKSHEKVEEALLYYNKALDEPDAAPVSHQILLNMALARFSEGSYRESLTLAQRAVQASLAPFSKAERLVELLESEYAAQLSENFVKNKGVDVQLQPARAEKESGSAIRSDLGGFERASDGLDDDLTEEVDFPLSVSMQPELSAENGSVFAGSKGFGFDNALVEDGQVAAVFDATEPIELEDIGDGLDLDLESGLDEMDFSVQPDEVELARQQRTELGDALAGVQSEDEDEENRAAEGFGSDWGEAGFRDDQEVAEEGVLAILAESGAVQEISDDEQRAGHDSNSHGNDVSVSSDSAFSQLLNEADPLAELVASVGEEGDVGSSGEEGDAKASSEATAETGPAADQDGGNDSSIAGVKWDTLSDQEIETYIMCLEEYPRLKVKPCPVRPRNS